MAGTEMTNGVSSTQVAADSSILMDANWFAEDLDATSCKISFVHCGIAPLEEQPFLDQRWDRGGLRHRQIDVDLIAATLPASAPPPHLNFIWHTSFCCSTLIAEALNRRGFNLSLREPLILVPCADAKRSGQTVQGRLPRLPAIVFRLLARAPDGQGQVTVKPSNAANVLISDGARLTTGKALFLYSDLPSFLVSVAKGGLVLRRYARRLFGNIAGDSGQRLPWAMPELFQMSDLEIAAIAWHLQIAEFRRSFPAYGAARAVSLDCDAFLQAPQDVLAKLDTFFGLGLGPEHIARAAQDVAKRNVKIPGQNFDQDRRRDENEAVRRQLGADLDRIVAWSYRACPGTPSGPPAPNPLVAPDKSYGP